jgi:TonB family protein
VQLLITKLLLNQIAEVKMKTKLFLIVFLFLISFGCKEEKQEIELIQSENVYLPLSELDRYPELQTENMGKNIEDNINIHLQKVFQQLSDNDKQNFSAKYLFLINENGRVDKIQIISSSSKKIDELFAKTVKDWKFTPALKNGKNVKSISPWSFNPQFSSGEIISAGGDDIYFVAVEEMPEPIGGLYAIQSKIKYPEEAKRNGVEGKVFIQAFIDETGSVVEAKVIKGVGHGLDEAALDAVKQTKFSPGKQKGKSVKVQVTIPIVFKLQ